MRSGERAHLLSEAERPRPPRDPEVVGGSDWRRLLEGKVLNLGGEIFRFSICFFFSSLSSKQTRAVAIIGIKELRSSLGCRQTREQSEDQASLFRAGPESLNPRKDQEGRENQLLFIVLH